MKSNVLPFSFGLALISCGLSPSLAAQEDASRQASDLGDRLSEIARQSFSRSNGRGTSSAEYKTWPNISACSLRFTTREGVEGRRGYRQTDRITDHFDADNITDLATGTSGVYGASYLSLYIADSNDGVKAVRVVEAPYLGPDEESRDNQIDLYFPSLSQAEEARNILAELSRLCAGL